MEASDGIFRGVVETLMKVAHAKEHFEREMAEHHIKLAAPEEKARRPATNRAGTGTAR